MPGSYKADHYEALPFTKSLREQDCRSAMRWGDLVAARHRPTDARSVVTVAMKTVLGSCQASSHRRKVGGDFFGLNLQQLHDNRRQECRKRRNS
jgi:hypothetical protein